jgi:hypothetical protein
LYLHSFYFFLVAASCANVGSAAPVSLNDQSYICCCCAKTTQWNIVYLILRFVTAAVAISAARDRAV